jgi:hypothetical protein
MASAVLFERHPFERTVRCREQAFDDVGRTQMLPVIDKSKREDGTFSREGFIYDEARDCSVCPTGKTLTTTGHIRDDDLLAYLASVHDSRDCPLKPNCCPQTPQRRVLRSSPRAMSRARSPKPKHLRSLGALARWTRCCSLISSASCGSAVCAYGSKRRAVRVHARGDRLEPEAARQARRTSSADHLHRLCVSFAAVRSDWPKVARSARQERPRP